MNLFKNMADQETAQYNSTTPITCLILCWLLINNNMKTQRPNTAHVFGIRVFNSPICPICFWSKLGFAENELIWFFILCTIVHLLNRGTPHCRIFNHLILTRHLHHHTPLVEHILKHLYISPTLVSLGHGTSLTHIIVYIHTYAFMCTSRTPSRLTLHPYVSGLPLLRRYGISAECRNTAVKVP